MTIINLYSYFLRFMLASILALSLIPYPITLLHAQEKGKKEANGKKEQQKYSLLIINKDSASSQGFIMPVYARNFNSPKDRMKELQKTLFACYDESYLTASFDSLLQDSVSLRAWLTPGAPYKWAYLRKGNVDELPLNFSGYREKVFFQEPFYYKTAVKLMDRILNYYENNGYPFARIKLDSIKLIEGKTNTFSASLRIEKKSVEKIDSIVVKGNLKIAPSYLYGYLGIKPGDFYDESKVKAITARLKTLTFLTQTKPLQVEFIEQKVKIYLYLDKKQADQFNGIVGILPNNTGQVIITGDISMALINSFHRAEELDFHWQHVEPLTEQLTVHFSYPYLFNTPIGIDENFNLFKQDTTYLQLDNKIGFKYLLTGGDYVMAYYESISTSLLSVSSITSLTADDQSTGLYGLEYNTRRLDYIYNPRSGYELLVSAAAGDEVVHENASLPASDYAGIQLNSAEYRGTMSGAYYVPVGNRSAIKIGFNGGYINAQSLLLNDLFRIGGFTILRGFDEQSIYASQYAVGTLEFHYLLEQNSFMFLFFDQGWCRETLTDEIQYFDDTPYGFGAGLDFQTKAGIFSLAYALGNDKQIPLNFKYGKINFGLVNTF